MIVTDLLEATALEEIKPERPQGRYWVGWRVVYKAQFPNSANFNYALGEMLAGTVISAFDNDGTPTYRIRLDRVWKIGGPLGKKIIVGNITEGSLCLEL